MGEPDTLRTLKNTFGPNSEFTTTGYGNYSNMVTANGGGLQQQQQMDNMSGMTGGYGQVSIALWAYTYICVCKKKKLPDPKK